MGAEIQNWTPKHDTVVLLYLAQNDNKTIGEIVGFEPSYVGAILRSNQAQRLIDDFQIEIRQKFMTELREELIELGEMSIAVLRKTLEADISPIHRAKTNQDNVARDVLKGLGLLSKETRNADGQQLPQEVAEHLIDAITNSDRVKELHEGIEITDVN